VSLSRAAAGEVAFRLHQRPAGRWDFGAAQRYYRNVVFVTKTSILGVFAYVLANSNNSPMFLA